MKNYISLYLSLLAVCLLSACADDAPATIKPTLPGSTAACVRMINHEGTISESYDWEFVYKNQRLTKAIGLYRSPDSKKDKTHSYTSQISYGSDNVTIKNINDDGGVITLNNDEFIAKITSNDITQNFYYKGDQLWQWERTYKGNSHGGTEELKTSALMEYEDENLKSITYMKEGEVECIITLTPDTQLNNNGLLPEIVVKELGLLGIEHLYYAGLFGKGTRHLVKSMSAEYPKAPAQNWTATFEYSHRDGNTILCNYNYQGQASSVRYTY